MLTGEAEIEAAGGEVDDPDYDPYEEPDMEVEPVQQLRFREASVWEVVLAVIDSRDKRALLAVAGPLAVLAALVALLATSRSKVRTRFGGQGMQNVAAEIVFKNEAGSWRAPSLHRRTLCNTVHPQGAAQPVSKPAAKPVVKAAADAALAAAALAATPRRPGRKAADTVTAAAADSDDCTAVMETPVRVTRSAAKARRAA